MWLKALGHLALMALLTALTQLGGLAWAIALLFRRRLLAFALTYAAMFVGAMMIAPSFGRVALPCFGDVLRAQSPFYCLAMRNYVTPEMAAVTQDAARAVAAQYPGSVTLYLDGSLPFVDGFPLLPHLSHDDGEKLDFAFYYKDETGRYLAGKTRSPIGFWAFETHDDETCPPAIATMRWSFRWMPRFWTRYRYEPERTRALTQALLADPRIGKAFLEPPLVREMGLSDSKLRFQGCRAARHDDHLHVQL